MISLKKNDKIIIIAAVVILVVAGVGIAMYQSPKITDVPQTTAGEKNSYEIIWTLQNGTPISISDFASKKTVFEEAVQIPEGNIKSITFDLTWADDRMTLLKRMGLDTFTLEVTTPDGRTVSESNTSAAITGEGSITKSVSVGIIPPSTPIKADDEKAAYAKLNGKPYYDDSWTDKDIKINISVQIGEMRILKKLRDQGNDFELKITYQFYEGNLKIDQDKSTGGEDNDTPPEDDDPWAEQTTPPYMSMIINTGCGRFV